MNDRYAVIINGQIVKDHLTLEEAMSTIRNINYIIDNYKIIKVIYDDEKKK